jgi:ABC-type amino acid transport system permease subunit
VGLGRLSDNPVISLACRLYIDLFRNIPSILQVVFWYQIVLHLPAERRAVALPGGSFVSNRGLYFPVVEIVDWGSALAVFACLAGLVVALAALRRMLTMRLRLAFAAACVLTVLAVVALHGAPIRLSYPTLRGFAFRGGVHVPAEFLALLIGLSVLGTAYVGEIVRGGVQSVGRGMLEAGRSLGLREWVIDWKIRIPLGLRTIVPPLGNQYLITIKNTSLGAAIGYSDLFAITSNSINMNGHTFEMLGLMVGIYLVVNSAFSALMDRFNNKVALKGLRPAGVRAAA